MSSASSFLLSRQWLLTIAADYATRLGVVNDALNGKAVQDALYLLAAAPWHFRLLVGSVEVAASLWCWLYRLLHDKKSSAMQEISAFEKMPVIAAPLLRLYRSLVAISWFENAEVLAQYGISEAPEDRQQRFRQKRDEAA